MGDDYYWVTAAPFRSLLEHLIAATGMSWRELAGRAHVPTRLMHSLLFGRLGRQLPRIPVDQARRILAPLKNDKDLASIFLLFNN